MGLLDKLFVAVGFKKRKVKIICCGLDNSGKSTIINKLNPKKIDKPVDPTVGFSVEEFEKNQIQMTVFDMSGQGRYRYMWECFYQKLDGIIFVIDSTDDQRLCVARDELYAILRHKDVESTPILILANKQDLDNAISPADLTTALHLYALNAREWNLVATDALKGTGIEDGIRWLSDSVVKKVST
ncbi:ADP-ribosylation factor-like protein [Acrasis kona]|uniref:ADP-ribosylation factor-like protein n=1 Tax=Acrasis kona TaxID=1008807 RepID=A0AAW2ZQU9_9EUKA